MEAASVSSRTPGPVMKASYEPGSSGQTETDQIPEAEEKMELKEAVPQGGRLKTTMEVGTTSASSVSPKAAAVDQGLGEVALQCAASDEQQTTGVRSATNNGGAPVAPSRDTTFRPEQFIGGVKNIQVSALKKSGKPSTSIPVRPVDTSLRKVGDDINTSWQPCVSDVGDVSEARRLVVSKTTASNRSIGSVNRVVRGESADTSWEPSFQGQSPDAYVASTPRGVSSYYFHGPSVGGGSSSQQTKPALAKEAVKKPAAEADLGGPQQNSPEIYTRGSASKRATSAVWDPSCGGHTSDARILSVPRGVSSYYFRGASEVGTSSSQLGKSAKVNKSTTMREQSVSSMSSDSPAPWEPSFQGQSPDAYVASTPRGVSSYYFRGASAGDSSSSQKNGPAQQAEEASVRSEKEPSLSRGAEAPAPWEPSFQGQSPDAYVASTPRGVSSYYFRGASARGISSSQRNKPAQGNTRSEEDPSFTTLSKSPASWEPSFQGQPPDAYVASTPRGVSSYYFRGTSAGDISSSQKHYPAQKAEDTSVRSEEGPSLSRTAGSAASWEPSFQGQSPDAYAASAPRGVSSYYFRGASADGTPKPVHAKETIHSKSTERESEATSLDPRVNSDIDNTAVTGYSFPAKGEENIKSEQSTMSTGVGGKAATSWEPTVHSQAGSAAARSLRVTKNDTSSDDASVRRVKSIGTSRGGWTSAAAWAPKIRPQVASAITSIVSKSLTNGPRKSSLGATKVGARGNDFEPWQPPVHSEKHSLSVAAISPAIRKGAATNDAQRENRESSSSNGDNSSMSWQPKIDSKASPLLVDSMKTTKTSSTDKRQETSPESTRVSKGKAAASWQPAIHDSPMSSPFVDNVLSKRKTSSSLPLSTEVSTSKSDGKAAASWGPEYNPRRDTPFVERVTSSGRSLRTSSEKSKVPAKWKQGGTGNMAASWQPKIHEGAATDSPFVDNVVVRKAVSSVDSTGPDKSTSKGTGEGLSSWQPKIHEEDGPFIDSVVASKKTPSSSTRQADSAISTKKGSGTAVASWQPKIHENASSPFIDDVISSAKVPSSRTQPASSESTRVSDRKAFASWQPEIHNEAATSSPFVDQVAMSNKAASVGSMQARTVRSGGNIGSWQPQIHEEDGPFIDNVVAPRKSAPRTSSVDSATSTTRSRANVSSWQPPIHEDTGGPFVDQVVSKSKSRSRPSPTSVHSTEVKHDDANFNVDHVQAQRTAESESLGQQEEPLQTQKQRTTGNIVPRNAPMAASWKPPFHVHATDAHQLDIPRGSSSFVDPYFQEKPKTVAGKDIAPNSRDHEQLAQPAKDNAAKSIVKSNTQDSDDEADPEGSSKEYIDPDYFQVSSREDSFGVWPEEGNESDNNSA
jgi:hypothetical protein